MKAVLAQMPALLPALTTKQVPPAASRAGQPQPQQPPLPLPLPMQQQPLLTPPPTTNGMSTKLLHQVLCMPPASEADELVRAKEPLSSAVQSLLDTHSALQQKEERKKWKTTEAAHGTAQYGSTKDQC